MTTAQATEAERAAKRAAAEKMRVEIVAPGAWRVTTHLHEPGPHRYTVRLVPGGYSCDCPSRGYGSRARDHSATTTTLPGS